MRRKRATLLATFAAACLVAWPAMLDACVGKTLHLGRLPGKEQEILAELFTWLISERTGTTVEITSFSDSRKSHSAMEKAEIDLYLEETVTAMRDILGQKPDAGGAEKIRQKVRKEYRSRFNFIWLEPWGSTGKISSTADAAAGPDALVAPVVRKDTLKKFPALSRLINKMAGVVDNGTMDRLLSESAGQPAKEVAKRFLKQKKLI